jgi:hypothetical protein
MQYLVLFLLALIALPDRPVCAQAQFDTVSVRGIAPYTNFAVIIMTASFRQTDQTIFSKNIVLKIQIVPEAEPAHILLGVCYLDSLQGNIPIVIKVILDGFTVKALVLKDKGTDNLPPLMVEDFVQETLRCINRRGLSDNGRTMGIGEKLLRQLSKPRPRSVFFYPRT